MRKTGDGVVIGSVSGRRGSWKGLIVATLLVASAVGCLFAWPVSENQHLMADGGQILYRKIVKVIRGENFGRLERFYGRMAQLRITFPHHAVMFSEGSCQEEPYAVADLTVDAKMHNSTQQSVVAPRTCGMQPRRLAVNNAAVKQIFIQKALPVSIPGPASKTVPGTAGQIQSSAAAMPQGPVQLVSLRDRATCNQGVSLNIVAHEDDDLLFMNPDIQADISAGRCVRTVYLTAGDSGQDAAYWNGRELGAKAAYAAMYHVDNDWRDERQLLNGKLVTVAYLRDVPQVSLVFLELPDGNITGDGFVSTANESLRKLLGGEIENVHTVTDKTAYGKDDIVQALYGVMVADSPGYIRSQNPEGAAKGDHADHSAAALLASQAATQYQTQHILAQYAGYSDKEQDPNVTSDQFAAKQSVFLSYAAHDNAVCQTADDCAQTLTYGSYLARQYKISEVTSGQEQYSF